MKKIWLVAAMAIAVFAGCTQEGGDSAGGGVDLTEYAKAAAKMAGCTVTGGELHIYTWCDYIAPEVLSSFERALDCKIVVDTFDSNEAMYAKLKAGGTGYDIITPSSYQIDLMAKEGMIEKFEHSRIPNVLNNFDKSFVSQILDPTFTYNVPYAVTYTGFAYDRKKVPELEKNPSWNILGNAKYKGRISLLDDMREVIGAGLIYLGYSVNSENAEEINAAANQILSWRINVRKFDGESYKTEVPGGSTWIGHGYSTDITQVIVGDEENGAPAREDIGFALPKEGFSIAFDEIVISKNAKAKDLAYAFINYIYSGEVAKVNMEFICGPCPVKPGIDALDKDYRDLIILDSELINRGQVLKSFVNRPEVNEYYNRAWDRVKVTDAK